MVVSFTCEEFESSYKAKSRVVLRSFKRIDLGLFLFTISINQESETDEGHTEYMPPFHYDF